MFLGLVAGFGMDYIKALLLVDMTAFLVLMLNPLWLGCGRARRGGKVYAWELPGLLVGRVSVGEKLIVRTSRGLRTVTVAEVEEYAG